MIISAVNKNNQELKRKIIMLEEKEMNNERMKNENKELI